MTALSKIDTVEYFKELPFYKKPIEKPEIKWLKNMDRLIELPFYKQLSVTKLNQALQGYAVLYKFELIEKKDPTVQLEASKSSIKDLFSDLLNEAKGFKYQITVQVLLKKYKPNGEVEFAPVYFNSVTKLVIIHRFKLEESFQEILYMIDAWIITGLAGLLNQVSHNTLTFQLIDLYQEVLI